MEVYAYSYVKIQKLNGSLCLFICAEDRFSWLRDDEFARQALAGVNPVNIERLQAFPPVSRLDPEIYGQQESALREEHISGYLNGLTVQQVTFFIYRAFKFFLTYANCSIYMCIEGGSREAPSKNEKPRNTLVTVQTLDNMHMSIQVIEVVLVFMHVCML